MTQPEPSFSPSGAPRHGTFYGAAVKLGEGMARSYITLEDGATVEVGVALSEAALRGLPAGSSHPDEAHAHSHEYLLPMHPRNPTPYRFVELNWNPDGHEPDGIYTLPHFDFHFYTVSRAERDAIDPADPQFQEKADRLPAPEYRPAGYVPLPGAVPRMGVHWADPTSPELNGEVFSQTFLYGSWDGQMIFAEPMITRAFLETKPNYSRTLPAAQTGYTPGSYRIYWNPRTREYRVALSDLPVQS